MPLTLDNFWTLLADSQLLAPDELGKLAESASKNDGSATLTPEKIAKFLVSKSKLSMYQAKILLAGHAGPFYYGDYQIYDRIESGRLAGIFRAVHTPSRHPVCLYFLSGQQAQDPQMMEHLAYQAAAANRSTVGHPHLFRCYHLRDEGTYKFIVIDDLKGRRVERLLATTGGPIAANEACRIARQAALGLARLHAMGQAHGEIRPANIWLDANEQVKLLLFPLYRDPFAEPREWLAAARSNEPAEGKIPSEADYIAPELITGKVEPDARSDVYSLGCTLYHMLGGRPPFPGTSLKQKLRMHLKDDPQPLHQLNPQVSPALAKLVGYMMAKDPDMRFQKAESVVEKLLTHLSEEDARTQPAPPTRASQAYEAWLRESMPQNVAAVQAPSAPTAAVMPAAEPVYASPLSTESPSVIPSASAIAGSSGIPMTAVPVTAAPMAAPAMAVPMAGVPVAGIPTAGIPTAGIPAAGPMMTPIAGPAVAYAAPYQQAPAFGQSFDPMASAEVAPPGPKLAGRARAAQRRQKNMMLAVLGTVVIAAVTLAGLHFGGVVDFEKLIADMAGPAKPPPTTVVDSKKTTQVPVDVTPVEPEKQSEPVNGLDEGLWDSPSSGKPIDPKYLAMGMQAVAALRPADILKHPEGKNLLVPETSSQISQLAGQHPLGTLGHWVQHTLPKVSGVPLEQIEQVLIGWPEATDETGMLSLVVRLTEPTDEATILAAWGNPAPAEVEGKKYFTRDALGYWMPEAEAGRVLVIAPVEAVKEAASGSPLLIAVPEVEKFLLKDSDADRHFTFVMPPRFLDNGGKAAFEGRGARLKNPVHWLLTGEGDDAAVTNEMPKAVLLSAHLADAGFFAEARVSDIEANIDTTSPAERYRERLRQIPRSMKLFTTTLAVTDFSVKLLFDLDDKLKAWDRETRFGVGDKQVVIRSYLPPAGGLFLVMGGHLCLLENPRGATVAAAAPPPNMGQLMAQGVAAGAADKLKKVTSLSFPRNTLEVSMQLLAEDLGVPVVILGTDLQLEGITKNQSFGLEENNKPAVEIFKTIFAKANPDGKLVYVIKPDDAGVETIFVTTRAAVAKRGDKLPAEFAK
jgi:serine/threonine protein kinase